ncbi:MAG: tRNA pseudouridine(55) synthase TruB [Deltaproteobacteria bacterium RIFCSPLOWO2_12_FULL_40_28]|nr:MAG: tRNA pseudouridine(55) synthase TruB [Deltaproteobacteria bacterium RIFCSPHIGHO2_02_FULL_40_28]OGQ20355.1 MAG: tRNA pseudouridine(55) synthase TruB [Deltaproteobacteria bacterium RIFCSPHIGHO2_12_FULL_40_32]OGQ41324.1 MAG: tRNA pseudouridine(55) synthase TruB [Deltaproteobacteria bacterium RIFCSPLOWO2_02_FULL_40_36]OGQ54963.1 MAG: tRNA pseudouridine(55) synthase TruB [Deltaproteobacteria bacterium RIFCSPLOWO2_12_FULL_40_28]
MNGFLLINKPCGPSSHDILDLLRKFPFKKIGHTGTLDPFASGLLVVGINESLKFLSYLNEEPKIYEATLTLGCQTDTMDHTGKVISEAAIPSLTQELVQDTCNAFIGIYHQLPPMFSAKKKDGKKLYELARKGITVERKEVPVTIHSLLVKSVHLPKIQFEISCSKGTYVREIGSSLAQKLGCVGHLSALCRFASGPFNLGKSIQLENLNSAHSFELISISEALNHWPKLQLTGTEVKELRQGKKLNQKNQEGFYQLFGEEDFIGMGEIKEDVLSAKRLMEYVL